MTKLSANFNSDEFKCPCCGELIISTILVDKLQQLRDLINKPIHISSGYRCQQYNKKVGGYSHSPHLIGEAADICTRTVLPTKYPIVLAIIASKIKGVRIGIYKKHIHIDIRPCNPSRYWLVKNSKYIYSKREKNLAKFLKENM